mgnify:CR=1 FL=1
MEGAEYELLIDLVRRGALCQLQYLYVEWHADKVRHISWADKLALRFSVGAMVRQRCGVRSMLEIQNDDCRVSNSRGLIDPMRHTKWTATVAAEWRSLTPTAMPSVSASAHSSHSATAVAALICQTASGGRAAVPMAGCSWWLGDGSDTSHVSIGGKKKYLRRPGALQPLPLPSMIFSGNGALAWYVEERDVGTLGAATDCAMAYRSGVFCAAVNGSYLFVNMSANRKEWQRFACF